MKRRTEIACESDGETISPSGVSEKRRSLGAPAIRASRMKRFVLPLMLGIGILCSAGYFGMYAYYRFINPDAVIDCFSYKGSGPFASITINESTCGESIVSRLSGWAERSIAPTVNRFYVPLAALDQLINGRSIRFDDAPGQPVFPPAGAMDSTHAIEIDPLISNEPFRWNEPAT